MRPTTKTAERKARFADLSRKIAALDDVQRAQLAAAMPVVTVAGHALSAHNACMIAMQCASATVVGGFKQWLAAGRCVRKGEHGMMILVPTAKKDPETGEPGKTYFIPGYVFDVSQTEELTPGSSRENPAFADAGETAKPDAPAASVSGYYSDEFTPL